jgi:hypothetical protein
MFGEEEQAKPEYNYDLAAFPHNQRKISREGTQPPPSGCSRVF